MNSLLRKFLAVSLLGCVGACSGQNSVDRPDLPAGLGGSGGESVGEVEEPVRCVPPPIDRFKELMIVDPTVLEDPVRTQAGGAWTFQHLVSEMAPEGTNPSDFVNALLDEWSVETINGFPATDRSSGVSALREAWPKTADDRLDLAQAPFRLIGIVNRLDLRDKARTDSFGEGRFIFAVLQNGQPSSFTVIFEYVLPPGLDLAGWAATWHTLGALPFGPAYNQTLEAITAKFTSRNAAPGKPNGSALGQLRTNDFVLGSPWELREFRLDASGALRSAPTLQSPDQSFNHGNAELTAFIQQNADAVKRGSHVVPTPMLAAVSPETSSSVWQMPGVSEELRHAFALQTCNGCHNGEAPSKDGFYHVAPGGVGAAKLSKFLHNPDNPTSDELARRAGELSLLLCNVAQDHNPPSAGPGTAPTPN